VDVLHRGGSHIAVVHGSLDEVDARTKAIEYFHLEAALQFRVVATKLGPVKTKETRNSFMYGTRHLQPR
jgi:hypothetical protein